MAKRKNKVPTPGKPDKPKRSGAQRERDFPVIAELYLQGHTQSSISKMITEGKKYKLSIATISKDIKHIEAKWLESTLVDFNEAKARELAKLDLAEGELWQAWHASKRPRLIKGKEGITEKRGKAPTMARGKTFERSEDRDPNPRYMDLILEVIDKRLRILGAFAPEAYVFANIDLNELDQQRAQRWQDNKDAMVDALQMRDQIMSDGSKPIIEGKVNSKSKSKNGKPE